MERPRSIGRRSFLYSTTGAALSMPFLSSLLPRDARAAAAPPIKRFVAMQSFSGQIANQWYPTAVPAGYRARADVFPGKFGSDGNTTYLGTKLPGTKHSIASLQDFAASGVSNILGTSLNKYLGKMNLLRGIDMMVNASHSDGAYFGNYIGTNPNAWLTKYPDLVQVPTIDQVLAYSPRFYQGSPRKRSLDLGTGAAYESLSFTNYGVPGGKVEMQTTILDPAKAWDYAFRGFTVTPGTPRVNPNLSLMNSLHEDYSRVSRNPRIGTVDKQFLDRHMTFLSDIERSISAVQTQAACTVPPEARSITYPAKSYTPAISMALQDAVPLLLDVAAAAIRCDVTRIVTFTVVEALYDLAGTLTASFHESGGVAGDWHDFAHAVSTDPVKRGNFIAISQWIARTVFGGLLDRLDVEEADGKTYLDNSLVVWGNELGYGHYSSDVQTVTAGSAGGYFKTGNYVDYIDWTQSSAYSQPGWGCVVPGLPHNRWLATMLQSMGLQPADYEKAGTPGYGYPKLVDSEAVPQPSLATMGTVLPGIVA